MEYREEQTYILSNNRKLTICYIYHNPRIDYMPRPEIQLTADSDWLTENMVKEFAVWYSSGFKNPIPKFLK